MDERHGAAEVDHREQAALYNGLELFDDELRQQTPVKTADPLDLVVMEAGKTFGDQDGRHKRA